MQTFKDFIKEDEEDQTPGKGIEIRFNNLDEVTQKQIMDQLIIALNVTADDNFANKKILDVLGKTPLFVTTGKEITDTIPFNL